MRRFTDLHLRLNVKNLDTVERVIRKSSELGYRMISIPLPPNVTKEEVAQLQRICIDVDIDFVTRVNLQPRTPKKLLRSLRLLRRKNEIVSVFCASKGVARQAAKDRRVDLLSFPSTQPRKRFFDNAEAELASRALSCLEIEMAPLLILKGFSRINLLSILRRETAIAKRFKVPVIISSGATDEHLIRSPRDYAALATLFDMSLPDALRALSEEPLVIVERNREKLSSDYVTPGVRVVRRKSDA